MICPRCHSEIPDDAAFCSACGSKVDRQPDRCPSCGAAVEHGARFCTSCGTAVRPSHAGSGPQASPDVTIADPARAARIRESASAPALDRDEATGGANHAHPYKKVAIIAACAVAVAAFVGAGVWYMADRQAQQEAARAMAEAAYDVTVSVDAEGWDTSQGASRLPLHVVGANADGTAVDDVCYVDSNGEGLLLVQGEYDVSIVASPIAADGTVYTIDGASQHLSFVAEDAAAGELPACSFSLAPVAAAEVTDDQIDAAWRYAADDASEGAPDAQALRTAAEKRRDDAVRAAEVAQEEAARKAAEEARHVVADSFELYLPAYWDGRVEADVEGDSVTIRSSEYRRLDICTITVQDGPSQVMGDIATSCMGSVPLGGGKYAVVWANRWAYIIGDAYMRNSSDPSDYYSLDEASEIVDLQTGGAYTYIEIRDDMVATDRASDLLFSMDPYLQEVVVNAIEPR